MIRVKAKVLDSAPENPKPVVQEQRTQGQASSIRGFVPVVKSPSFGVKVAVRNGVSVFTEVQSLTSVIVDISDMPNSVFERVC